MSEDATQGGTPWSEVSSEFVAQEERRVNVFVSKARASEKLWTKCVKEETDPQKCVSMLESYINNISTAYCPLQVRDTNMCWKNRPETECKDETRAVWNCLEAYARIANLSLLSKSFDSGLLKKSWEE
eukprot:TRINITY_DN37326_c0_g1_i1.p1 TRINITY_DN37326_c0_g1~~TRINITY_DN37326_c0_g1_i1.p1  ORF type:complete len:128 (+),score=20.25 TRINITY_DN37326_c0_g1_i1:99-482(+)